MMGAWRDSAIGWRGLVARVAPAFAALALMVQVLIPQGFMVSGDASAAPGLVICTGHGPLLSLDDHGQPAKAPKAAPDCPCTFTGHLAGAAPPPIFAVARLSFEPAPPLASRAFDVAPGRGLAAPPPPSPAPPLA